MRTSSTIVRRSVEKIAAIRCSGSNSCTDGPESEAPDLHEKPAQRSWWVYEVRVIWWVKRHLAVVSVSSTADALVRRHAGVLLLASSIRELILGD